MAESFETEPIRIGEPLLLQGKVSFPLETEADRTGRSELARRGQAAHDLGMALSEAAELQEQLGIDPVQPKEKS